MMGNTLVSHMFGASLFGGLLMFVFWASVILFLVWIAQELLAKPASIGSSALSILQERYAKGEINKEEFEQKKHDLA